MGWNTHTHKNKKAIRQFLKESATFAAVKGGHVEQLEQIAQQTITLHCSHRRRSLPKLSKCIKHACSACQSAALYSWTNNLRKTI